MKKKQLLSITIDQLVYSWRDVFYCNTIQFFLHSLTYDLNKIQMSKYKNAICLYIDNNNITFQYG